MTNDTKYKSIDRHDIIVMRRVKIPGSRYELSLEDDENQWFLRLRIGAVVEEAIPVTHMDKKAVRANILELLEAVHLQLNDLQIDQIHDKIVEYISEILAGGSSQIPDSELTNDPRVPGIVERINIISEKIEILEDRITKVEGRSSI